MSRAVIGVIVIAVVIMAAVGIYLAASASPGATPSTTATTSSQSNEPPAVQISVYASNAPGYRPDTVTLVIGVNNTVAWTNIDSTGHTVTSTSAPSGASFDSGNLNSGAKYTHTFAVPGTYQYKCSYHSQMTGTIVVKAGS